MKSIKFYFDKAVNTYEKAGKIQKKVAEELLNRVQKDYYSTIIEIGSGKGFLSIPLIEKLSFERFIHVDISFEFLKRLKADLKGICFFINAQAEMIPLKESLADLIVSSSTLHWLENPEQSFIELFRIIKEGGKFYFTIFTSNTLKELKLVSEATGFGSVYPLKEAEFYIEMIQKMGFFFNFEIKTYKEYYSSTKDLITSHKLTGTNYTKDKRFSGKGSYRKFCSLYETLFTNHNGVYATYEVLFIEGQKLSLFLQH